MVPVKEIYDSLISEHQIKIDPSQKRFSSSYLEKARHNLELASLLDKISRSSSLKDELGSSEYYDWIIIVSYYAMYMAATSALAKLGLKCDTHRSSIIALEYRYCIKKSLLEKKYISMIESAHFGVSDVHKLDNALKSRIAVQYTVSSSYTSSSAVTALKDATEFVSKIAEILV